MRPSIQHLNILSEEQRQLLPFIAQTRREYYLVGGTAIALHIGHRYSIDFDLFKKARINQKAVFEKLDASGLPYTATFRDYNQINLLWNGVKCTFFQFPYSVPLSCELPGVIRMPDLLTLAAMKAFALGRRAKWKDYVDLYFILKEHYPFEEIAAKAEEIFGQEFIPKLFKSQLGFFGMMDRREEVSYAAIDPPSDDEIKDFLIAECVRL